MESTEVKPAEFMEVEEATDPLPTRNKRVVGSEKKARVWSFVFLFKYF